VDIPIVGDCRKALQKLIKVITDNGRPAETWKETVLSLDGKRFVRVEEQISLQDD